MEPEGSSRQSQVPATFPYPVPARSSPCPHIPLLEELNYVAQNVPCPVVRRNSWRSRNLRGHSVSKEGNHHHHHHRHHHHHHHHIFVMELGHLLTRSGLTYSEVSSKICHNSFCQLENSVSLPWVIYYEACRSRG